MSERVMFQLTEGDQKLLLRIARHSVRCYFENTAMDLPEIASRAVSETCGTFVSIHKHASLRGCIGNLRPVAPLYRSVAECAISAAVEDPRFAPMTIDELQHVQFEISVLSALEPVEDVEKIEVGKHGLLISKGERRGLLLPQVPATYGWDRITFLQETCRKAGLRPDDWNNGAAIHSFSAVVFGEQQFQLTAVS